MRVDFNTDNFGKIDVFIMLNDAFKSMDRFSFTQIFFVFFH